MEKNRKENKGGNSYIRILDRTFEEMDKLFESLNKDDDEFVEKNVNRHIANKTEKSTPKQRIRDYEHDSYVTSIEAVNCDLLIQVLAARKKLFDAASEYYDTLANIERENVDFGFDLNI